MVHGDMYILENWRPLFSKNEAQNITLNIQGAVHGNPSYLAGAIINTSTIVGYRQEAATLVVLTITGSAYQLGKPDAARPLALRRLMRYLQEMEEVSAGSPPADLTETDIEPQLNLGTVKKLG
jgi:hypothetical protein